jgi:hypothetical protein
VDASEGSGSEEVNTNRLLEWWGEERLFDWWIEVRRRNGRVGLMETRVQAGIVAGMIVSIRAKSVTKLHVRRDKRHSVYLF